jgi:2,3,4,5-tetrahydropyridine-2-carboxylate N-succinyltransferase
MSSDSPAWGLGLATITDQAQVLDTWYPAGRLGFGTPDVDAPAGVPLPVGALFDAGVAETGPIPGVRTAAVLTMISSLADAPKDTHDVYLRLHLLSHRLIRPHQANLDGVFGLLANVAWTSAGPCLPEQVDELRWTLRTRGERCNVYGIDKFPRMVDYVTPSGVRIADADRVRLGAHLATGTTVMHEGFVNFNAGTLGSSMIEGRISAGVVVGSGTDVGGGASIMGTLSGGGKEIISIGERCLIGANGGVGISLGDDCVVEAGTYVTPGSKIRLPSGEVAKARDLSGQNGLLFWRNSLTGALEVRQRTGRGVELNTALHTND